MRHPIATAALLLLILSCTTAGPVTVPAEGVLVPVAIVNTRVHIPVSVNGLPPGTFILDTGAGGSPLAKEYADVIGVKGERRGQAVGAAGSVPISIANDVAFRFGTIDLAVEHAALIPFGAVALRAGRPINGVLGRDVFTRYVTEIDYAGEQVSFHSPRTWRPPAVAISIPIEIHRGLPHVRARLTLEDGRTLEAKLLVDTGAGAAVILKKHYTDKHNIRTEGLIETSAGLGVGGATHERVGRLARLEFGGITIDKPVTTFSLSTAGAFGDPASDGLIGGEILNRFRFIVDYPHDRLHFVPTDKLREPFEYDMSGILLTTRDASFNAIDIFAVLPGSPAAEAGLTVGDELLAVDARKAVASELPVIRRGFRQEGNFTLTVRRNGVEQTVILKTRRMV